MTRLTKPVSRVVAMDANDGRGKRDFVVTLHPDGEVHIRTKGSRRHYSLPFAAIFWHAARAAANKERFKIIAARAAAEGKKR